MTHAEMDKNLFHKKMDSCEAVADAHKVEKIEKGIPQGCLTGLTIWNLFMATFFKKHVFEIPGRFVAEFAAPR